MRGEALLDVGDDGLRGLPALGLLARGEFPDLGLRGADRKAFLEDQAGDLDPMSRTLDAEQRLGMSDGKLRAAQVAL
jgi:hypothetical protein